MAQPPAGIPNYQITFDDGKCMWADGAATGSAIYKNRGGANCNHGASDLWEFVKVREQNGTPIYHIQLPVANPDKCLAITGTPSRGEDLQLEPCVREPTMTTTGTSGMEISTVRSSCEIRTHAMLITAWSGTPTT